MSITRRQVCDAVAAGTVLLLMPGCGGGGGDASPPRSATCGASGADISLNHGHALAIAWSDLDSMLAMTYSIRGASDHDHTLTLDPSQLRQLKAGGSVTVAASASAAHSHLVTVACAS